MGILRRTGWVAAVWVVGAGCAHSERRPDDFVLRSQNRYVQAQVRPDGIQGPQFNLARTSDGLRGSVERRPVSLELRENGISGVVGALPTRLEPRRDAEGLHAKGLVRGEISEFVESDAGFKGRVGRCNYDLRRNGNWLDGFSQCGGRGPERITVQFPATLETWSDAQRVAALSLLLTAG